MDIGVLLLLVVIGLAAGCMNTIVGGASTLTVPLLISINMSPVEAIGTNRFTLIFLTLVGSIRYAMLGKLQTKLLPYLIPPVASGAFLGAILVQNVPKQILKPVIGVIAIALLGMMLWNPEFGVEEQEINPSHTQILIMCVVAFVLGIYGGAYGAGVSTLFCFLFILFIGCTMIQGIGTAQVLAFCISLAAGGKFLYDQQISYSAIIPLAGGMGLGAWLGPWIALKIGNTWVKYIFSAAVLISALNILIY